LHDYGTIEEDRRVAIRHVQQAARSESGRSAIRTHLGQWVTAKPRVCAQVQKSTFDPTQAEEVGAENFFLFGLTVEEIEQIWREGYHPERRIEANHDLRAAPELLSDGTFSRGDRELFRPLVDNLRYSDPFLVLVDYADYLACQERVSAAWQNPALWTRMSILNTARSGKFSSDRAIREYAEHIWNVRPVPISLD
jgi:glucan phosphorylase